MRGAARKEQGLRQALEVCLRRWVHGHIYRAGDFWSALGLKEYAAPVSISSTVSTGPFASGSGRQDHVTAPGQRHQAGSRQPATSSRARGTGKTTTAKILAMSLNCEAGQGAAPSAGRQLFALSGHTARAVAGCHRDRRASNEALMTSGTSGTRCTSPRGRGG